ncbi:MAG TPA: hypothetical protein VKZ53_00420 [Candidatus Angelobacter sp.]|nr:hypothetical protein [Candidatus Angelobacter sp.]
MGFYLEKRVRTSYLKLAIGPIFIGIVAIVLLLSIAGCGGGHMGSASTTNPAPTSNPNPAPAASPTPSPVASATPAPSASPTPISGVPSTATTSSQIQQMTGWENCTVCAGLGGNGPVAVYTSQQGVSSPSLSGKSMQFSLAGRTPYADAIWWKQLGPSNSATHFQYDLDFYVTAPQYAQALEFDVNQSIGSRKFIFGTQCNIQGGGVWDVWDTAGSAWRHTAVPCSAPTASEWHHLTWEFYRDDVKTYFVAVTLDGVKQEVNVSYNSMAVNAQEVNVAFQMDGDSAQHPYDVWLDNVTLSYW